MTELFESRSSEATEIEPKPESVECAYIQQASAVTVAALQCLCHCLW